jgi:hypothetical protein
VKKIFLTLGLAVSIQSATAMETIIQTKNGITKVEDEKTTRYYQEINNAIVSVYRFKNSKTMYVTSTNLEKRFTNPLEETELLTENAGKTIFAQFKKLFEK